MKLLILIASTVLLVACRPKNSENLLTSEQGRAESTEALANKMCSAEFSEKIKKSGIVAHTSTHQNTFSYINAQGIWADPKFRQRWIHQSQGTKMLPLSWVLAMQSKDKLPFLSDKNISRFNVLPDHDTLCNPFELPIGMAVEWEAQNIVEKGKGFAEEPAYLGLSCASCHVTPLRIGGKSLAVLGGAGSANMSALNIEFENSIKFALRNPMQALDFFKNVQKIQIELYGESQSHIQILGALKSLVDASGREAPVFGPGRLDALGGGGNFMFEGYLKRFHSKLPGRIPKMATDNSIFLDAPVGMPAIFDVPRFDWAYYGASFREPFTRAMGETVAVLAPTALMPESGGKWQTSARGDAILWLEQGLRQLSSPRFSSVGHTSETHAIVQGARIEELANEGEELYWHKDIGCARCHGQRNITEPGVPVRRDLPSNGEFLLNTNTVGVIGTDPLNLSNFASREINLPPEIIKGLTPFSPLGGSTMKMGTEKSGVYLHVALEALMVGVSDFLFKKYNWGDYMGPASSLSDQGRLATLGKRPCQKTPELRSERCRKIRPWIVQGLDQAENSVIFPPSDGTDKFDPRCKNISSDQCKELQRKTGWLAYRARPLVGMWSTAPFLHNNSIESMCALLGNTALANKNTLFTRKTRFTVGTSEYDPICLGYRDSRTLDNGETPAYVIDTTSNGNMNGGHWYDARYSGKPENGVIGPALSERQIFSIIEYMKSDRFKL